MKPFLILQIRANDEAADGEFFAFLKHGEIDESDVVRIRMEQGGIPEDIRAKDFSAVIVGGGPYNISDDEEKKSPEQMKAEKDLDRLLDEIVENDIPFLGACYGFGALIRHQGGVVSKENYSEGVGALDITLTDAAQNDPLTSGLPKTFRAFGGHKEACQNLPTEAELLAGSEDCPVHMLRMKRNIYATQFHPELDVDGMITRINVYKNAGYFPPEDAEPMIAEVKKEIVTVPAQIMKRFVDRYSSKS